MRVLGLMMVRDGEEMLSTTLSSMSLYCDAIYVLNDRSTDATLQILQDNPTVQNVFSADSSLSASSWYFAEANCLRLLYTMADFYHPDWCILLDHDMILEPSNSVRDILDNTDQSSSLIYLPCISVWSDPTYPALVPLMSEAKSIQGRIWRYYPGLVPGSKRLHNTSHPANILDFGEAERIDALAVYHYGWDTLEKRLAKVRAYMELDPRCEHNFGVPYDRGLLFGYTLDQLPELLREYERRARSACAEPAQIDPSDTTLASS
jgi:hypothetical protein